MLLKHALWKTGGNLVLFLQIQQTDHAVCMCKDDQQVWCFGCGRKLDEVKLSFSQDIEEYHEMKEEHDTDDNDAMDMVSINFYINVSLLQHLVINNLLCQIY